MENRLKIKLVLGAIALSIALMIFGSHGSFNPSEIGFYTSIGAGILWYGLSYFLFKKYMVRKPNGEIKE